jgi:hypothetical protein
VELAGRDRERFTGTTVEKDVELVQAVLGAVVAGVPHEHIARLGRISVHTVLGIVERAEKAGQIAGWKERMSRHLARGSEVLAQQIVEDAINGKLPAGQKAVAMGIVTDKKLLVDGEATSRVEHVERVRPEDILAQIKRAQMVEIEGKTEA